MRINKFIAAYSEHSRRKADELIQKGLVFLNGKQVTIMGVDVDPTQDVVKVDGQTISVKSEKIYLALYKPKGYITTRKDEKNRPTVMELLPQIANLKPVGRLDENSEGLLLVSNDGEFINHFTHPKFEREKEYVAKVKGLLLASERKMVEDGMMLEGKKTHPANIEIIEQSEEETFIKIIIHEGRNRQIRKMFDSLNHPVKYLKRIRIGNITLGVLQKGAFRPLTKQEINVH
jgi:23S rRNA pseudouridine2605 synthase